jgi:hypothetical protein
MQNMELKEAIYSRRAVPQKATEIRWIGQLAVRD